MAHNNGIITAPVNTDDVAATLGVGSNDVGTLCSSDAVNPWAKYKPFRGGGPESQSYASRKSYNFGLGNVPWFSSAVKMCQFMGGNTTNAVPECGLQPEYFIADKPVPGQDWTRLDDFINSDDPTHSGYWDDAMPPISGWGLPEIVLNADAEYRFIFGMGVANDMTISLADIKCTPLGQPNSDPSKFYLGVGFASGSNYYIASQETPLSQVAEMGAVVRVPKSELAKMVGKKWCVFPFIANKCYNMGAPANESGSFALLPFPYAATNDVGVREEALQIVAVLSISRHTTDARLLSYSATITNNGASGFNYTDLKLEVFDNNDALLATHRPTPTSDNIAAKSSKSFTGQTIGMGSQKVRDSATKARLSFKINSQLWAFNAQVKIDGRLA